MPLSRKLRLMFILLAMLALAACNLGRPRQQALEVQITRQPLATRIMPTVTPLPVIAPTRITLPTSAPALATRQYTPPTAIPLPQQTVLPNSIYISSPLPGTIITGDIQIFGSASHANFQFYRLEYASQPNPPDIWQPISGDQWSPAQNSVLGLWRAGSDNLPAGLYQLRLRMFLLDGKQQQVIVPNLQVPGPAAPTVVPTTAPAALPRAEFNLDIDHGFVPLTVQFTGPADASITQHYWDFGDGNRSNAANPLHVYAAPGEYTASLTVDSATGSSSYARVITVENQPAPAAPLANFSATPSSGAPPLAVQFSNQSSGDISAYHWDFGDGDSSAETHPAHIYQSAGAYEVVLLARGPGGEARAARQIVVQAEQIAPPTASFSPSVTEGQAPLSLQLTNTSSGAIESYHWDFNGDGFPDSLERDPAITLGEAGEYNIQLTVAGPGGQSSAARLVFVSAPPASPTPLPANPTSPPASPTPPPAPVAAFSAEPLTGTAPLTVVFSNQSLYADLGYVWDFDGDGAPDSTAASPTWVFESPGSYNVSLTAAGAGGSHSRTSEIIVQAPSAPPLALFSAAPEAGVAPLTVQFSNQSSGDIQAYEWDFQSDGQVDSREVSPAFVFENPGTYSVNLTALGPGGAAQHALKISVAEPPPPTSAPTGQIAFMSDRDGNNEIYLMKADVSDARNLSQHPANDRHPAWSPDGRLLAFSSQRDGGAYDIYLLELATLAVKRLTQEGENIRPAFSPDGERIAFSSDRFGNKDIMLMNADGSQQQQLTFDTTPDDQPSWSPDGGFIAYAVGEIGKRDIQVISVADDRPLMQLTKHESDDFHPAWLNDTTRSLLAFTSTRAGNQDVFIIDPQTGADLRQVTSDASAERQPAWITEEVQLLFLSDRGDELNIYRAALDGSNPQRLTPSGSDDREAKWQP